MKPADTLTASATERAVIACIIEHGAPALLAVIEHGVVPSSFAHPLCRRIHEAILRQHATGLPFDLAHLWERIAPTSGEAALLLEITGPGSYNPLARLPSLCAEVRQLAVRRRVLALSEQLTEAAGSSPGDLAGIIGELLATQAEATNARTWKKVCDDAEARAQDAIAGRVNAADYVSWGFPAMDANFKPMRKGELVIVGARPSVGKSSLARGIAVGAALAGRRVLVESLEVSPDDVADGMATGHSGVPLDKLAGAPADLQRRFLESVATIRAAPLHVFGDRTLSAIVARAQSVHASQPLDVLVIDYLGLIADCKAGKGETTAQAVGAVTKALKRLAMESGIVVICLAQLNRQSVNEGNREPRLSDLRDSGDVEQDADRVVFIHRPDECPISKRKQDTLDTLSELPRYGCALVQAKGRSVGTAYGAVWFNRKLARFEF